MHVGDDRSVPLTIVTGGSRGIGRHVVRSLLARSDVLELSRTGTADAPGAAHRLHHLPADLADTATAERTLCGWLDRHPGHAVHTVVHNAAIPQLGRLHTQTGERIAEAFAVNVVTPLTLTGALVRSGRLAADDVRIAYVVSSLGRPDPALTFAGLGLYSATKAAIGRAAQVQAHELAVVAPQAVISRIHPGIVDTALQRELRADPDQDPAFRTKTAGLPDLRPGEWDTASPAERMRTISPVLAAEFVVWVLDRPGPHPEEWDLYRCDEFHRARDMAR